MVMHTSEIPIRDEKGTTVGGLNNSLNITEKLSMQTGAINSSHLTSLGELAAGVAHEINNPINSIINYAQILVNKSNNGSAENDIANRIIKESKRIATIVNGFLSFSRHGDRKDKNYKASIPEILSDTLVLAEEQLKRDAIKIKIDIQEKLPEIIIHPQLIQQVFMNIINNACYALNKKYPGPHSDKILEIRSEEVMVNNCSCVKTIFCDRGTGIPANILDKVMNPFVTTKPKGEGTGLGLSVSHAIVCKYGGKLTIDSVEGKFTKATVILPAFRINRAFATKNTEQIV